MHKHFSRRSLDHKGFFLSALCVSVGERENKISHEDAKITKKFFFVLFVALWEKEKIKMSYEAAKTTKEFFFVFFLSLWEKDKIKMSLEAAEFTKDFSSCSLCLCGRKRK